MESKLNSIEGFVFVLLCATSIGHCAAYLELRDLNNEIKTLNVLLQDKILKDTDAHLRQLHP